MRSIKLYNKISKIVLDVLPRDQYQVSEEEENPVAALVRSASLHDMPVPDSLLAVARAGAGVNNIPVKEYAKQGIAVFNTPGANANAVAELVLLGMLMCGRRVVDGIRWAEGLKGQPEVPKLVEKGKGQFVGPELRGKTLGVIGLGAIGALVANAAANGLGMRVVGVDPFISVDHAWSILPNVLRANTTAEVLEQSDFVTLHVPLLDATRGMVNRSFIAQMKDGASVLNFSRAELVDGEAVRGAISDKKLSNYVIDFPTDDMLNVPGVICIPHLGASTPESEENCAQMAAESVKMFLETGAIWNSVNLPDIQLGKPEGGRVLVIHENADGIVDELTAAIEGAGVTSILNKSRGDVAVTAIDFSGAPGAALLSTLNAMPRVYRVRSID
ncbi:MAG: 3-phosphoglycerate dehydrogenase family protein [Clostridia bacterium]|nr:3-phosphoglycerate dehydrogenase family protein [Clostridia bacterium]